MGYPNIIKAVNRKLTPNIVTSSCPFSRFDKFNFGARMALLKYDNEILVWSPIPFGKEVVDALNVLNGTTGKEAESFNLKYLIIPDREHTLAAKSFKKVYPSLSIISMETVDLGDVKIDHVITSKYGNKKIDKKVLEEIGILDPFIVNNFEFVYLPFHANKELVLYDKNSKIVFAADIIFNLGVRGTTNKSVTLEQYSPETGYTNFNPHLGWSYFTRYLQPYSSVGNYLARSVMNTSKSSEGLKAIDTWDFDTWVMCHGNVLEKNGKQAFENIFHSVL
ncbi:uncharacterized protein PRCAT00003420001 [Priceomyces carsonii]|uniref:uncharacterized protein n=1 Tax=Priceomyces carsonii TaxID=28549 RepID=UPI002ED97F6D|nr:unnamed protein product [Priceomyces carsonii]